MPTIFISYLKKVHSVVTGSHKKTLVRALSEPIYIAKFSPNGDLCVVSRACSTYVDNKKCAVQVFRLETGEAVQELRTSYPIVKFRFSADGSQVLAVTQSHEVLVWDLTSKAVVLEKAFTPLLKSIEDAAWSPDGASIYLLGNSWLQVIFIFVCVLTCLYSILIFGEFLFFP